jgi:hypothetical protein
MRAHAMPAGVLKPAVGDALGCRPAARSVTPTGVLDCDPSAESVASHQAVRGGSTLAGLLRLYRHNESRDRCFEQFERVARDMPEYIRLARFSYVHELAYQALAVSDQRVAMWFSTVGGSFEGSSIDDLIDMLAGAITAPVHSR